MLMNTGVGLAACGGEHKAMARYVALGVLCLSLVGSGPPRDDPKLEKEKPPLAERIRAVLDEYQAARKKASEALEAAGSARARQRALALAPNAQKTADRLGKLSLEAPDDPDVALALSWIVSHTSGRKTVQALEKLVAHHARNPRLGELFPDVLAVDSPRIDTFLEEIRDHNPDRKAQAYAVYSLARRTSRRAQASATAEQYQSRLRDAVALYDKLAAEFADVPLPESDTGSEPHKTLGELARLDLAALRAQKFQPIEGSEVAIGRPAPETLGPSTEGVPLRLADFKGRVVLLDFWGDW